VIEKKKSSLWVWVLCAILIVVQLVQFGFNYARTASVKTSQDVVSNFLLLLFALICAVIGSLIISRQPRNTIGWLLITIPVSFSILLPFQLLLPSPGADLSQVSALTLWAAWLANWSWWMLVGPILLIPLLFPTGKLLSHRWRWVVAGLLFEFVSFVLISAFQTSFQVGTWITLKNPIGWLSEETVNWLMIPFQLLLITLAAFCVAALFIRYRRAVAIEREQIKWLFYVFGVFLALLLVSLFFSDNKWYGNLLDISFLTIPLAIGMSILRYRLWDIDILIRRTISYAILTITLGLSYLGSVLLLQGIFERLFASTSQVVIVFSTLLIAALFTPLRRRIQAAIDRRFYRQKYDAARALAEFSAAARQEVALEPLKGSLVGLVEQTIQPEAIWLWIREDKNK
jgi:hypothetical protein